MTRIGKECGPRHEWLLCLAPAPSACLFQRIGLGWCFHPNQCESRIVHDRLRREAAPKMRFLVRSESPLDTKGFNRVKNQVESASDSRRKWHFGKHAQHINILGKWSPCSPVFFVLLHHVADIESGEPSVLLSGLLQCFVVITSCPNNSTEEVRDFCHVHLGPLSGKHQ